MAEEADVMTNAEWYPAQVAYHIAEGVPRVMLGDAQRLQQILLNVLNNAVKFTEQGAILLEVWAEPVLEPRGCEAALTKSFQHSGIGQIPRDEPPVSARKSDTAGAAAGGTGSGGDRELLRAEAAASQPDACGGGSLHGSEALSLSEWAGHVPTPADDPGTCGEGAALDYQGAAGSASDLGAALDAAEAQSRPAGNAPGPALDLGAALDAAEAQSRPEEVAAPAAGGVDTVTLQSCGACAARPPAERGPDLPIALAAAAAAAQPPQPPAGAAVDPKEAVAAAKAAFNLPTLQRLRDLAIPAAAAPGRASAGEIVTDPRAIGTAAVVADHSVADARSGGPAQNQRITGATPAAEAAAKEAVARADGQEMLVHFSVRDTGIGISKEDLGLLFQSFSQACQLYLLPLSSSWKPHGGTVLRS